MTDYEMFMIIVTSLSGVFTFIGVIYAGVQIGKSSKALEQNYKIHKAEHDWNRRIAAQNALKDYSRSVVTGSLQKEFNYLNIKSPIPVELMRIKFDAVSDLQNELHSILNYYEGLARGIQQSIYDEQVIKSGRYGAMKKALYAFKPYIDERRISMNRPTAWENMESIVNKWEYEKTHKNSRNPVEIT